MEKFHKDIGFDDVADRLFDFNISGNQPRWSSLNQSSKWYQAGLNFSFVGGPKSIKPFGVTTNEDFIEAYMPSMGRNGGQLTAPSPCSDGISSLDCDGDEKGICDGQCLGSCDPCVAPNDDGVECSSHLMNGPRTYLIHPRISINSQHYSPTYKQCLTNNGDPVYVRFYHEIGANPEDPTAGYYDAKVAARRLMGEGTGGGCGVYQISECNVPSGIKDLESPYDEVISAISMDQTIIVYEDPIPDFIRPAKLPTIEFMKKYQDVDNNPETAQDGRMTLVVDQYLRPIVTYSILRPYTFGDRTVSYPFGCGDATRDITMLDYSSVNVCNYGGTPYPASQHFEYMDQRYEILSPLYSKFYFPSSPFGAFSLEEYQTSTGSFPRFIPASKYIPTEKAFQDIQYDLRDGVGSVGAWAGDSGSAGFQLGRMQPDGFRDVLFLGLINTGSGNVAWWGAENFKGAIERICDEYEMPYPEYADENYDISDLTTTIAQRPSLGYKVYRSIVGRDGPYQDITNMIRPFAPEFGDADDIAGYPCVDPSVPCYTISENFIDTRVEEGNTYWYYTTTLESVGDNYSESEPSDLIEITVPTDIEWTDPDRQLFVSNNSASYGSTSPLTSGDSDGCYDSPLTGIQGNVFLCDGYRLGDNTNSVPMMGFTDPFNSPLSSDGSTERPCLWYKTLGAEQEEEEGVYHPNQLRPFPRDNTSYQYIAGYPYNCPEGQTCTSANRLNLVYDLALDSAKFADWSRSITEANFTRLNENGTFEPYFHSKINIVQPGNFSNVDTLKLNPARYGNGRSDYGENWDYMELPQSENEDTSYLGYYAGEYLFHDIGEGAWNTTEFGSGDLIHFYNLKNLIAKDSKLDSQGQNLEYFRTCCSAAGQNLLSSLTHLDLSNNNLFLVDIGSLGWSSFNDLENGGVKSTFLEYLDLSHNNLCGSGNIWTGGMWLNDPSFPSYSSSDSGGNYLDANFMTFPRSLRYANLSNNPQLKTETNMIYGPGLNYLDVSNTSIASGASPSLITDSLVTLEAHHILTGSGAFSSGTHINFVAAGSVANVNLKSTLFNRITTEPSIDPDRCHTFSFLDNINISVNNQIPSLNLRYYESTDWIDRYGGGSGVGGIPEEAESGNDPHVWGTGAPRLKSINASSCVNLKRLYLPTPQQSLENSGTICTTTQDGEIYTDSNWTKQYLEYVDITDCKLGIDGSLEEFLNQEAFNPEGYPDGHTLVVDAMNNQDQISSSIALTDLNYLQQKVQDWATNNKNLIINTNVG